jgi:hypothetical protein
MESWDGTPLRCMQAGRGGYDTIRYDGGRAGGRAAWLLFFPVPAFLVPLCVRGQRRKTQSSSISQQSSRAEQSRGEEEDPAVLGDARHAERACNGVGVFLFPPGTYPVVLDRWWPCDPCGTGCH